MCSPWSGRGTCGSEAAQARGFYGVLLSSARPIRPLQRDDHRRRRRSGSILVLVKESLMRRFLFPLLLLVALLLVIAAPAFAASLSPPWDGNPVSPLLSPCLLYTSDAADE